MIEPDPLLILLELVMVQPLLVPVISTVDNKYTRVYKDLNSCLFTRAQLAEESNTLNCPVG